MQDVDDDRQAEQPQWPQERQHDDREIEEVPEEPPKARIRQVEPGEVIGDEDEVGGHHRHVDEGLGGAVRPRQDLHRVQREEDQSDRGERPFRPAFEAREPGLRGYESAP